MNTNTDYTKLLLGWSMKIFLGLTNAALAGISSCGDRSNLFGLCPQFDGLIGRIFGFGGSGGGPRG